jgi:hypothetical protein
VGIIESETVFDLLPDDLLFVKRRDEEAHPGAAVGSRSAPSASL